jgi:hypothetical protein
MAEAPEGRPEGTPNMRGTRIKSLDVVFGRKIAKLRRERNLNWEALGDLVGLPAHVIQLIELAGKPVKVFLLVPRFANALNCQDSDLLAN